MKVKVVLKKWLKRNFKIEAPLGNYELSYNGRGLGSEKVTLNGEKCIQYSLTGLYGTPFKGWFAPTFEINNSGNNFKVEVRIWPWLTIRSLYVYLNNKAIYKEGSNPYKVSEVTEKMNAILSLAVLVVSVLFVAIFFELNA